MAAHGLEEFEYEHGGLHIRLRRLLRASIRFRHRGAAKQPAQAAVARPQLSGERRRERRGSRAGRRLPPAGEELHIIKSPIVGTFYSAPSPEARLFVKAGDAIHAGQVVCIIEAMKLMNEIEADVAGEVVRVLVENGQPVEYGQATVCHSPDEEE